MNYFTLKVAWRYLFSKKSHSAVNIISFVALCGVVVTAAACVCVLSVYNGFSDLFQGKYAQFDPQLKVYPSEGKVISDGDSLAGIIKNIPGVTVVMPTIEDNALAKYGKNQMPVMLKGVVAEKFDSISKIRDLLIEESQYELKNIYGDNMALLSIGSASVFLSNNPSYNELYLFSPRRKGRVNIANPMTAFRADTLGVSGVFKVDEPVYDNNYIIVPIDVTRKLFDYPQQASAIEVGVANNISVESMLNTIQSKIGSGYVVKDGLMQQDASFRMVNIEKWITFLLLGFIFIIATFNVVSTLAVLVIEKDASIETFMNLGATNKQISNIFITEGWLINICGAVLGVILGIVLCLIQQYFGVIKLSGDPSMMIISDYPVRVRWSDMTFILVLLGVVGTLTTVATGAIMRHRLKYK